MIQPIPTLLSLLFIFILYPHLSSLDRASGSHPAFPHGGNETGGNLTAGLSGRPWGGVGFVRASPQQLDQDGSDRDRFYPYEAYHHHHHHHPNGNNHNDLDTLPSAFDNDPSDTQGKEVRAEYDPPLRHDHMRNPHYHPHLHHPDTYGHFYKGHLHHAEHGGHEQSGFSEGKKGKEPGHDQGGWEGVGVDAGEERFVKGEYDSVFPDQHDTPLTVRSKNPDLVGSSRWSSGPYAWRRSALPIHPTEPSSEEEGHLTDIPHEMNNDLEKRKEQTGGKKWSNGPYAWKRVTGGSSAAKTKGNGLNRLSGEGGGGEKDEVPDRAWDGQGEWR